MTTMIDIYDSVIKFNGKEIDIVFDTSDNIWFSANQVVTVLEYSDVKQAIKYNIDKSDRVQYRYIDKLFYLNKRVDPQTIFINEVGLYTLILKSRMKEAIKFKDWIVRDVIPSLRKYGIYEISKNEKKKIKSLNKKLNENKKKIQTLEHNQKKEKYPDGGIIYAIQPNEINKNLIKIGISTKFNKRINTYETSLPNKVNILYLKEVKNPKQLELCLKSALYDYRYRNNKEYYKCKLNKITKTLKNCENFLSNQTARIQNEKIIFKGLDEDKEYIFEFIDDETVDQIGGNQYQENDYYETYKINKLNYIKLKSI